MTHDEVVHLCEALLDEAGFTPATIRGGAGEVLANLSDDDFMLAVRFAYGDRPEPQAAPVRERPQRQVRALNEDEMAERLSALEELDEETPSGPIDIGDGVTLL